MDSIFGKFSVYDFFNVIIAGITFLTCMQLAGIVNIGELIKQITLVLENEVTMIAILLIFSYIVGLVLQITGSIWGKSLRNRLIDAAFQKKSDPKFVSYLLRMPILKYLFKNIIEAFRWDSVGDNKTKSEVFKDKADQFLQQKKKSSSKEEFGTEDYRYFFAYCVYYLEVKGKSAKPEKMREIYGVHNLLSNTFLIAGFVTLVSVLKLNIGDCKFFYVFVIIGILFWSGTTKALKYRIRMVLSLYDVETDLFSELQTRTNTVKAHTKIDI